METKLKMEGFIEVTQDDLLAINGGQTNVQVVSDGSELGGGGGKNEPKDEFCHCGTLKNKP